MAIRIIGEENITFAMSRKRKSKVVKLKLRKNLIDLTVPDALLEKEVLHLRKLAASIYVQCQRKGFTGTLRGRFGVGCKDGLQVTMCVVTQNGQPFAEFASRIELADQLAGRSPIVTLTPAQVREVLDDRRSPQ